MSTRFDKLKNHFQLIYGAEAAADIESRYPVQQAITTYTQGILEAPLAENCSRFASEAELDWLSEQEWNAFPEYHNNPESWSLEHQKQMNRNWFAAVPQSIRVITEYDGFLGDPNTIIGMSQVAPIIKETVKRFIEDQYHENQWVEADFDLSPAPHFIMIETIFLLNAYRRRLQFVLQMHRVLLQHVTDFYNPEGKVEPVVLGYPGQNGLPLFRKYQFLEGRKHIYEKTPVMMIDSAAYATNSTVTQANIDLVRSLAIAYHQHKCNLSSSRSTYV